MDGMVSHDHPHQARNFFGNVLITRTNRKSDQTATITAAITAKLQMEQDLVLY